MWLHLQLFVSYYLEDDCYTWSLVCTIYSTFFDTPCMWWRIVTVIFKSGHPLLYAVWVISGFALIYSFIVEVVKILHVDSFIILMLLLFEDVDILCIWPLFCFSLKGEMCKFSTTSGTKQNCKILFSSTKFVLVPLVVQKLHTSAYKEKHFPKHFTRLPSVCQIGSHATNSPHWLESMLLCWIAQINRTTLKEPEYLHFSRESNYRWRSSWEMRK